MDIKLVNNEIVQKSWDYATVKGKAGGTSECKLIITDKRIMNVISNDNTISINEIDNKNISGYEVFYGRNSALKGIICLLLGVVALIIALALFLPVISVAIVLAVLGIVFLLVRPCQLVISVTKSEPSFETMTLGASSFNSNRKTSKKIKVTVKSDVAKEIALEVGNFFNSK